MSTAGITFFNFPCFLGPDTVISSANLPRSALAASSTVAAGLTVAADSTVTAGSTAASNLQLLVAASCIAASISASSTPPPQGKGEQRCNEKLLEIREGESLGGFGDNITDPVREVEKCPPPSNLPVKHEVGVNALRRAVAPPLPLHSLNTLFGFSMARAWTDWLASGHGKR